MIVELGLGAIMCGIVGLHLRIEHRLTRLETKIEVICTRLQEIRKCDSEK